MPGIFEEVGARAVLQGASQYLSQAQRIEVATASIGRSAAATARQSDTLSVSLSRAGSRMQEISGQATILGAAILAPAVGAAHFAIEFEQAMLRVSTLSGVAAEDIAGLREEVLKLSGRTAQAPQALAEALLAITSTGLRGAAAMEVLEQSAKAAAVGLGDVETVGRTITGILKAYEQQGIDAARASDILFATVREGGAEADEVAGAFGRVTGIAATFGVKLEEVGAFVATFTRLGVSADEAVTALRGTITSIFAPASQTAEALEKFGLSSEQLRQTVVERGLLAALQDIIVATKGDTEALDAIIPNVRALAGVLGTAGSQAEGYKQVIEAVTASQGLLDSAFEQTAAGPAFRLQQALADIQRALIELGASVLPALVPLFEILGTLASAFAELPDPIQAAVAGVLLLSGAFLTIGGSVGYLLGGLLKIAPALIAIRTALAGTAAVGALSPPVLIAIAAAAVIAGGAYLLLRDRLKETAAAQEELTIHEIASKAAQQDSADALQTKIDALEESTAAVREELRILQQYGAATKFTEMRTKELTDSLVSEETQLAGLTRAQHVQALAQQIGIEGLRELKTETETRIRGHQATIASLEQERDANVVYANGIRFLTARGIELEHQIALLRGQIDSETGSLLEANAALRVAESSTRAVGAAAAAASTGLAGFEEALGGIERKLLNVTAEALATMVVLRDIASLEKLGPRGEIDILGLERGGILHPEDLAADILRRAEALRAQVLASQKRISAAAGVVEKGDTSAANEAERAAEEAARAQERLNEELARIAADSLRAAQEARERIAQQTIQDLDQLGDLIVQALRAQAEEELAVRLNELKRAEAIDRKTHLEALGRIEAARDEAIEAAEKRRDGVIAAIEGETAAVVAGINAQIAALDDAADAETRTDLERQIALSFDPEDRAKAERALRDFDRREQQEALRAQAIAVQDSARDRIEAARRTAEGEIEAARKSADEQIEARERLFDEILGFLEDEERKARETFARETREFSLQSRARELIVAGEMETIAALLDAHVPEWQTAGLSFGQQLIQGLRDSGVEQYINDLLARASRLTGGGAGGNPGVIGAVGGPAAAAAAAGQISAEQAAAQVIQDNGRAMVLAGAPQIAIQDLRDYLTSQGIVPEFARGLDMGVIRQDTLAGLHAGERVVTPEQWESLAGPRTVFEAGAFDGFLRGAVLSGDPRENARAIRRELETFSERQLGRDAFLHGA